MGVNELTEGTSALKRKNFEEDWAIAARQKAHSKLGDPERRRKIAEAKKGKPRPRDVIDAMTAGRRRKGVSEEARRKMREAHAKRKQRAADLKENRNSAAGATGLTITVTGDVSSCVSI